MADTIEEALALLTPGDAATGVGGTIHDRDIREAVEFLYANRVTSNVDLDSATPAADINAILAAGTWPLLAAGRYLLEEQIVWPAALPDLAIIGAANYSSILSYAPGWAPSGNDDRTNDVIRILGTAPATVSTTLSAKACPGDRKIQLTSATGVTVGMFLRAKGNNTPVGDATGMSDGASVLTTETWEVAAVVGTMIELRRPVQVHHNSGKAVVNVVPKQRAGIIGVTLDFLGSTHAVGIRCDDGIGLTVDVHARGFRRAVVDCDNVDGIDVKILDRGDNSAGTIYRACRNERTFWTRLGEGGHVNAAGTPRWAINRSARCTNAYAEVRGVDLSAAVHDVGGWKVHNVIDFFGADTRAIRARNATWGAGTHIGGAWAGGFVALGTEEFSLDVTIDVRCSDVRGADDTSFAVYRHDGFMHRSSIVVRNRGRAGQGVGGTGVDGEVDYFCNGVSDGDVQGSCDFLDVGGCFKSWQSVGTASVEHDYVSLDGNDGVGASLNFVLWDHGGVGGGPGIKTIEFKNGGYITFGASFAALPDWALRIDRYRREGDTWSDVTIVRQTDTGNGVASGELMVITPGSAAGQRDVTPATAAGTGQWVMVEGLGFPGSTGHGIQLAAPLPGRDNAVLAAGSVAAGAFLECNASQQAVTQASPTASVAAYAGTIGIARTSRTGAGKVQVGPR